MACYCRHYGFSFIRQLLFHKLNNGNHLMVALALSLPIYAFARVYTSLSFISVQR